MALTQQGTQIIAVVSMLAGLASAAVGLRMYARVKLGVRVGIDDHLCLVAWACLVAMLVELVLCTSSACCGASRSTDCSQGASSAVTAATSTTSRSGNS